MLSRLVSLLQISDSFFPTGAFTQSFGLETYIQAGLIFTKEDLKEFLTTYLLEVVATSDSLAMVLAYRAAKKNDIQEIIVLDRMLAAQKLARESREGSEKVGKHMLQLAGELFPSSALSKFREMVNADRAYGHHAIVFGLAGQSIGAEEKNIVLSFMYNTAAAVVSSAVRLVAVGQSDGQWVLREIHGALEAAARKSMKLSKQEMGVSAVGLEIRSMQHEHLYSRLFMS